MPRFPERDNEPTDAPNKRDPDDRAPAEAPPAQRGQSDSIARRAFDRFQERGGEHARDQDDWLQAERELNKDHHEG
jgi:hypothetical protein